MDAFFSPSTSGRSADEGVVGTNIDEPNIIDLGSRGRVSDTPRQAATEWGVEAASSVGVAGSATEQRGSQGASLPRGVTQAQRGARRRVGDVVGGDSDREGCGGGAGGDAVETNGREVAVGEEGEGMGSGRGVQAALLEALAAAPGMGGGGERGGTQGEEEGAFAEMEGPGAEEWPDMPDSPGSSRAARLPIPVGAELAAMLDR